ncbi:MAG: Arm DNA-binding domain-containing protein, partial [Pseudomonadota bacterium]
MPLTHIQITKAKPKTKPYKIADGGGLFLLVNPSGSKLWRMKYRVDGKEKLLSFGPYPDLSLQNARRARESAREQIALGNDPGQIRREEKEKATALQTETFEAVANLYLEKLEKEGRALTTLSKKRWLLNMAIEDFGQTQVRALTAPFMLFEGFENDRRG